MFPSDTLPSLMRAVLVVALLEAVVVIGVDADVVDGISVMPLKLIKKR